MKRLLGILLLGLGAFSMVIVSSAVPGGRSAHAVGASSPAQTAQLWVGTTVTSAPVFRYKVGIDGTMVLDFTLDDGTFSFPGWFAFSPAGEMFVMNHFGGVSRFLDPQGTPAFNGTITSGAFFQPLWGSFRGDELFVINQTADGVLRFNFDAAGDPVDNGAIPAGADFGRQRAVQARPETGELFVTVCCGPNAVRRYTIDASGDAVLGGNITGGGLSSPHDLAFSPWGELFVVNGGNHTISRFLFSATGVAIPNGVITESTLSVPLGVDFSPWGELFVANRNDGLIHRWVFDEEGDAIFKGSFNHDRGIHDLQFAPSVNQPPTADAGFDQTVECAGPSGTSVTLDGTMSNDPDPFGTLSSFAWTVPGVTLDDPTIAMPTGTFPLGMTTATLTVTDESGASDTDEVVIIVEDTTDPTISSVSASPGALWVPNHKMTGVTVSVNVSDICDSSISSSACEIVLVSSNEPVNGTGDGATTPDWVITGSLTVDLRAERAGDKSTRIYTITVECTDASGNISSSTVEVPVPHSQGKGQ